MDRDHNNQQQPPEQQQHRQLYSDQSSLVQPQTNQQTTHITAVRLQHTNQEHAYYDQDVHKMKRHPELQPYVPSDRFITFSTASGSSTIKHNNINNNNSYTKSPSNYCGNRQQQVYSNNYKTGDSGKTSSSAQPKRHVSMTRLNQLAQPKKRNVTASTPAATTKPQPPSSNSSTRSLYSPNNRKPFNTSNKNSANGPTKQNQKTTVAQTQREDKATNDRRLRNEKELSEKFINKPDVDEEEDSTKIEEELREKARLDEEEEDLRRIALEQELLEKAKLEEKKEQEKKLKLEKELREKARLEQEEEEKRLRIEEEIREKARLEEEERKERDQIVENILSRFSQGSVS